MFRPWSNSGCDQRQHLGAGRAAHAAHERVGVALAPPIGLAEGSQLHYLLGECASARPAGRAFGDLAATASSLVHRPVSRPDAAGPTLLDGRGDGVVDVVLERPGKVRVVSM